MLCDVNYDVRHSSYISWIPVLLTFCLWNVIEYFSKANCGDKTHTQTHVYDMWFYVMCMHIREMGASILFLKCQTFTCIGLELRKTHSLRMRHFCYQVRLTKDTERET
jgi:hypothetical protein